ncbi:MAG: hypothetical protein ACO2PN_06450 [Pyrobaculum sp.]
MCVEVSWGEPLLHRHIQTAGGAKVVKMRRYREAARRVGELLKEK